MMDLGSLGNGGSSSFSNLSPLAPPFTVDRSNSRPGSSQLLNFSNSSYTGTIPFGQSWQYGDPSAAGYNFFPKHEIVADSVPTTCMPLSPEFSPSDSVKPSSNLWSTSNPNDNASTDTYSFGREGYYAPYVPSVVNNDHPSAVFNEPSIDVLLNSGNIPVNASSLVNYTQSLADLEYPVSHWNVWSQVADGKQDERKGVDGSFSLGKVNAGASFGYRNCMSQSNSLEGVNIAGEDFGAVSGNFTDGVYTGPSSMGHMDAKSYLTQEPVCPSFNSKAAMGSILPFCQAGLSLGSSKNYLNYENPFTPHEKFCQPLDSCPCDTTSTSKSSPVVVIRPAPSGSRFFAPKTNLQKNVDICKTGASNSEKSDVCDLLKGEETRLPIDSPVKGFSLGTSPPLDSGKTKDIFFASSSINNQCSRHPCGSNSIEIAVKERSGSQAPYSSTAPMTFTEKYSDAIDLHNPDVDSPCWKGAPAFRISLCDSVEAPSPCHFKSKLECSDFGQSNPLFPPAEHSGRTSLKKLGEGNLHNHSVYAGIGLSVLSEGAGTNNYITEEHRSNDVTKETSDHMDLSSRSGVLKFSEDLNKHGKGYNLPQYSENDCQLQSSSGKHLIVDEHKYRPTKNSLTEGLMHSVLNFNDTLESGVVALDAAENVLRSPASQEDAKQAQPYQMGSSPKLDVQTLVHAIHDLSELLLKSQCLTNACVLEEQDHDALKHAIASLGACTAKKIEMKDTMFSQHDKFGESRHFYMGTGTGHPQFIEEVTWDSCGLGNQLMHEDKSKNNDKKAENSPLLTPPADELGYSNEEQVAQAIKEVLNENLLSEEGIQPQALLFKNLWLEAESKLCYLSYKARFDCMKIEMEKHKFSQGKDLNLNSSVAPDAENDLASKATTQSLSTSSIKFPH